MLGRLGRFGFDAPMIASRRRRWSRALRLEAAQALLRGRGLRRPRVAPQKLLVQLAGMREVALRLLELRGIQKVPRATAAGDQQGGEGAGERDVARTCHGGGPPRRPSTARMTMRWTRASPLHHARCAATALVRSASE